MSGARAPWPSAALNEIADVIVGQSPPGTSYNTEGEGLPFFQGAGEFGALYPTVQKWTTHDRPKVAPKGSILLSVRAPVGPTNLAPFDCAIGRGLVAISAASEFDQGFLLWALRHLAAELARAGAGSTISSVKSGQVKHLQVPAPPLAEQREIVEAIERLVSHTDAATSLVSGLRYKQATLKRTIYAAFYRDASHVAGQVSVGKLLERIEAGKSFKCPGYPAAPDKPGVLKLGAVTWGEFDASENKEIPPTITPDAKWEVRPGDLIIGRANTAELVGATALVREVRRGLYLSDKTLRLVPRSGVPARWIKAALASPQARKAMSAVASGTSDSMRNISQAKLKAVVVPAVPTDASDRLDALEAGLTRARRLPIAVMDARTKAQLLRRSILKAAFEGRLTSTSRDAQLLDDRQEAIA